MSKLVLQGRPPREVEPSDDEIKVKCYHCGHIWVVPFSWNLVFWGWVDCPECNTKNEMGDG